MRYQKTIDGEWKSHRPGSPAIYWVARYEGMRRGFTSPTPIAPAILGHIATGRYRKDIGRYHYGSEAQYTEDDEYHIHDLLQSHRQQKRSLQRSCKIRADFLNAYYTDACSMLAPPGGGNNREVYKMLTHLG
jgi:hypothetical protein